MNDRAERARLLESLRGRLIVSVQAEAGSPLNDPQAIALLARVAERNDAAAVRIEGRARIEAVRRAVSLPIVGIEKRAYAGFATYITQTVEAIDEIAAAGADVVAFDATMRPRYGGASVADLVRAAHERGLVAMADCSCDADAAAAADAGADVLATTLAGYTDATRGRALPALDLVRVLAASGRFVVCEGGVANPGDVRAAFAAGADAVVAGTALTNVDVLVRGFARATPHGAQKS